MDFRFTEQEVAQAFPREPWAHQVRGVVGAMDMLSKHQTACLASPTGSGKGLMQTAIWNLLNTRQGRSIIYNNRRILVGQTADRMGCDNFAFGVRAASMKELQNLNSRFQVGSIQTDIQRVVNQGVWDIHECDLVIVDEAHTATGDDTVELLQRYLSSGAKLLGITATPLEISHIYQRLVVAGKNSELRRCGSHVRARVFAPHEMDCSQIRVVATGEFSDGDISKKCWSQAIVGYIYSDWLQFNPDRRPTLIAAPGVSESIWVTEMFARNGVRVSHIDARGVWLDGELKPDNAAGDRRKEALRRWMSGETEVMVNCNVLQEGFDFPGLYQLILARPYGSLKSYLQIVGRVIRKSESTPESVIITDHGGNYWRHGSPNADRDWDRLFFMSEKEIREERERNLQEEKEPEPIVCGQCKEARASGDTCPYCGFKSDRRYRLIVEQTGQLREVDGRVYVKPPHIEINVNQRRWDELYYSARRSNSNRPMSFAAAAHIFKSKYGVWPPKGLRRLPQTKEEWGRKIRHVDTRELT
jgi:DNA repair protein RadD